MARTVVYKEWALGIEHVRKDSDYISFEPLHVKRSKVEVSHLDSETCYSLRKDCVRHATKEDFKRIGVVFNENYDVADNIDSESI